MTECGHVPLCEFRTGGFNTADPHQWICSGCGKHGDWTHQWSYFGAIGCLKCKQEPVIDFVACSDTCRAKYEAGKRVVSRLRLGESLRQLNEQIECLQRQRQALVKKLTAPVPSEGADKLADAPLDLEIGQ